jgi:hypothetical protein
MAQAKIVGRGAARRDLLELRRLVVTRRQVEADRPAAARAIVAIALAQRPQPRGRPLPPELQGVQVTDDRKRHEPLASAKILRSG